MNTKKNYCELCGAELTCKTRVYGYDENTGKEKYVSDYKCPNYHKLSLKQLLFSVESHTSFSIFDDHYYNYEPEKGSIFPVMTLEPAKPPRSCDHCATPADNWEKSCDKCGAPLPIEL